MHAKFANSESLGNFGNISNNSENLVNHNKNQHSSKPNLNLISTQQTQVNQLPNNMKYTHGNHASETELQNLTSESKNNSSGAPGNVASAESQNNSQNSPSSSKTVPNHYAPRKSIGEVTFSKNLTNYGTSPTGASPHSAMVMNAVSRFRNMSSLRSASIVGTDSNPSFENSLDVGNRRGPSTSTALGTANSTSLTRFEAFKLAKTLSSTMSKDPDAAAKAMTR